MNTGVKKGEEGDFAVNHSEWKSFMKMLMTIVVPIAMQSLLTSLVSASDALMLGLMDQSSLSAISLAGQIAFVLSLFFMAISIGAAVMAAQYWGSGDSVTVEKVLGISLRLSIPVSSLFMLCALIIPDKLMLLFTSDTNLIALGIPYLRIVSFSYLMMGISQMYLNIMRNTGRVKKGSLYASTAVVLNILLNFILIFGLFGLPRLEIKGAALATVISRAVELLLCLRANAEHDVVKIRLQHILHAPASLQKDYFHYMLPVLANSIAWGFGVTMFSVIMGHLGSDAVAANSIATIISNIIVCFCNGLGEGSAVILGNTMGAGALEQAKEYSRKLILLSIVFGAISGIIILLLIPVTLKLNTSLTPTARTYLLWMMVISSYYVIGRSLNGVLVTGTFCAGGDTRFGFICDLINMWCFIIPVSLIAAFVLHLPALAVFFLLHLDEIVKIPFEMKHYRKYTWLKNITQSS